MRLKKTLRSTLATKQKALFLTPYQEIQEDLTKIYKKNQIILGWPKEERRIFDHLKRKNTAAIIGIALGDEGKGRIVDNQIGFLLDKEGIEKVVVVRFQGGNNSGHTVEKDGFKLDLHLVPSFVFHKQRALGIIDQGMAVHPEDLQTEVEYIEGITGSLKTRLFLAEDAILCTDLERAEELLNRKKSGKSEGGTGRGISPSYAHHYDRLGLKIYDLLDDHWQEKLENQYDRYEKEFQAYKLKLADILVPDFRASHQEKKPINRSLGSKKEFLARLKKARQWLIKRKMTINSFLLHQKYCQDKKYALLFEGAQAVGLNPWVGTIPDVTSSNTSLYGVIEGTGFWLPQNIEERIGVFKATYTSSVGARRMPTHIDLPKDLKELDKNASLEQKRAAFIREEGHEYGTTTQRPRDINHLDLAFLSFNARMAGIEVLTATHLDLARENEPIKVCTHYADKNGTYVPYQPGLRYQANVIPNYVELPSWDGKACQKAKKGQDLPVNALKFLSFIQARTGFPITAVTTGAKRENILSFS